MLLQFDLKHIHKVNFYPSDNNFTQALLVLLVTNMISGCAEPNCAKLGHAICATFEISLEDRWTIEVPFGIVLIRRQNRHLNSLLHPGSPFRGPYGKVADGLSPLI